MNERKLRKISGNKMEERCEGIGKKEGRQMKDSRWKEDMREDI